MTEVATNIIHQRQRVGASGLCNANLIKKMFSERVENLRWTDFLALRAHWHPHILRKNSEIDIGSRLKCLKKALLSLNVYLNSKVSKWINLKITSIGSLSWQRRQKVVDFAGLLGSYGPDVVTNGTSREPLVSASWFWLNDLDRANMSLGRNKSVTCTSKQTQSVATMYFSKNLKIINVPTEKCKTLFTILH